MSLTYNEFKSAVLEDIEDYIPAKFGKAELKITEVKKSNIQYEGIIVSPEKDGPCASPIVNLTELYNYYKNENLEILDILEKIEEILDASEDIDINSFADSVKDFEQCKPRLFFKLLNKDSNKEFLKDVPHKQFFDTDLVLTYNVSFSDEAAAVVNYQLLSDWKITEDELYIACEENAPKHARPLFGSVLATIMGMPPEIGNIDDMIEDAISSYDNMPASDNEMPRLYYLSSEKGSFGAATVGYKGILEKIHDRIGNFYVLPSSIHELLVIPETANGTKFNADDLADIVSQVNDESLDACDKLSDGVYYYSDKFVEL